MQVQALGFAWYKEADYQRLKAMFIDGHKLPATFLQWQDQAEQGFKRYLRQGYICVKAHIDPDTFPDWCRAHGLKLDAHARTQFASAEAGRIALQTQQNT